MNRIEVFIKDPSTGDFERLYGHANVVNLTVGNYLDEQLDEARIVIKNSAHSYYAPLLEVIIEFYEDEEFVGEEHILIANPQAEEHPIRK